MQCTDESGGLWQLSRGVPAGDLEWPAKEEAQQSQVSLRYVDSAKLSQRLRCTDTCTLRITSTPTRRCVNVHSPGSNSLFLITTRRLRHQYRVPRTIDCAICRCSTLCCDSGKRCRAGDIAFSVVDNVVAMHCLRLGTATLYDFLLQPSMPADGSRVPLFDPIAAVTQAADSAGSSKALGPPGSARYLPPCHAIDLDSLTLYRCCPAA